MRRATKLTRRFWMRTTCPVDDPFSKGTRVEVGVCAQRCGRLHSSDMATDTPAQERRLLYVAMTRAKDDLSLIIPQRFFTHQQASTGDRHVFASRSRFIPSGILDGFASSVWPVAQRQDCSTTRSRTTVAIDLKSRNARHVGPDKSRIYTPPRSGNRSVYQKQPSASEQRSASSN